MSLKKTGGKTPPRAGDISSIGNVPLTAYEKAKAEWAERMGEPIVEKNRWFLMAAILAIALVLAMFGFNHLIPLKTVEPFYMEVDRVSGETVASSMRAKSYLPQEKEIRYFTAKWLREMISIGPSTGDDLQSAYKQVRGTAVEEFKQFITKTNVFAEMKADPSLRRTVEIGTINFVQERVALVRIVTTTRSMRGSVDEKRFIVNINFEIDLPKEDKDLMENPIGFYVTHFDFREDLK